MANYKEEALSGSKWVRSNKVTITNPYNGIPSVNFGEEEIAVLSDGKVLTTLKDGITQEFDAPTTPFNLINPATGATIGTAQFQDVYVLLHSLYISLSAQRDLNQG